VELFKRWRRRDLLSLGILSSLAMTPISAACGHDHSTPNSNANNPRYFFRSADATPWSRQGIRGLTLTTDHDNPEVSASLLNVIGVHGRVRSRVNTRLYYVLEGPVTFEVDGHEFDAQKGDTILVPKGKPYDMRATNAQVLLVNAPAFDKSGDSPA
jgi:mannose-6-phosphate isomerase-like protein (cupin superfamily)